MRVRLVLGTTVALTVGVLLVLAGAPAVAAVNGPAMTIDATPSGGKVAVTTEIGADVTGGVLTGVTLTDSAGHQVAGALLADGSAWVPAKPLKFHTRYTATIFATSASGAQQTSTSSFTTMAEPAGPAISTSVNVFNNATYGTGMPIVLNFGTDIPKADRAAVESRLYVRSVPQQPGIWSWQAGNQVVYRPETVWQTGTQVTLTTEIAGLPVGNRVVGKDHAVAFTIGRDLEYTVNTKTHYMTVTSNGKVLKKYAISAGKPSLPSWSGKFVIMERDYYTVFDTRGVPGENYVTPVNFAERLTWSGMFLHSAPWSVWAQGQDNVSHGCINLPPSGAKWVYQNSHVGDRVTVTGTGVTAALGNGWTAWMQDWASFAKGSAVGSAASGLDRGATPAL